MSTNDREESARCGSPPSWEAAVIDQSRVADGILFATHGHRGMYLGTPTRGREQWLEHNPGKWRRLEDVQREAARLQPPVEGEITIGSQRYASAQRVASMLGISPRTLSRWAAVGNGPPKIKLGKKVMFDVVKLSDWVASREV
jgi:hypothetical protein